MNRASDISIRTLALAIAAAIAAALLVLLLDGGGTDRSQAAAGGPTSAAAAAAAGRATARQQVALLRRPRSATRDALPPPVLGGPLLAGGVLDVATVRKAPVAGASAYVASSGDGQAVCAVVDGALGCASLTSLLVDGTEPSIMGRAGEPHQVFGVAAAGVSDIELVQLDDSTDPVTVVDGFYLIASDDYPQALTWLGPSGAESFEFPPLP
ncbi:hypothetical protein [Conexibacter arvalis]|uniref:Uncharacterized protein n=1 Tax=Conexibacter arvalis TaxID=912552 RepID=A0A840IDV4_9ACTN|nr:hypothetical protein [Conexibacter arvalis]MBB4662976.1 hypothetical protein [Conexibacter arvalis]